MMCITGAVILPYPLVVDMLALYVQINVEAHSNERYIIVYDAINNISGAVLGCQFCDDLHIVTRPPFTPVYKVVQGLIAPSNPL